MQLKHELLFKMLIATHKNSIFVFIPGNIMERIIANRLLYISQCTTLNI